MPAAYSGDRMEDRVYGAASPSPLEQADIDKAIAASLALPAIASGFGSSGVLPAVATAFDDWLPSTQEAIMIAAGSEERDQTLQKALASSAEQAKNDNVESGPSAHSHSATTEGPQATQTSHPEPWTITNLVEDMAMRLAVELPLLNDSEADTLVFM